MQASNNEYVRSPTLSLAFIVIIFDSSSYHLSSLSFTSISEISFPYPMYISTLTSYIFLIFVFSFLSPISQSSLFFSLSLSITYYHFSILASIPSPSSSLQRLQQEHYSTNDDHSITFKISAIEKTHLRSVGAS